jgi:uncharacterized membrane protein YdbT with pleckstrin-like domain
MDQSDYQWVARTLAVAAVALLVIWVLVHAYLPWWASALLLAGVPIAAIEAVRIARAVSRDE